MDFLIYAFDLASQSFHTVPQPQYPNSYRAIDLGILEGSLCVVCTDEKNSVDVWVMREYGIKKSWSKLVVLTLANSMSWPYPFVKPIMYLKNGKELLLEVDDQWLEVYDIAAKETTEIWAGDASHMSTFVYQEGLVPLLRIEQVV
ncbi:F-box protein CPR1-like [Bidens hawaiensis]|uniref:F-box protein CPR1-like n=1 Tax=Bidens hawaiensis TaxID=980011 RepID=UPI00404A83D8